MSLSIRPAAFADIPAITRIYDHAVQHGTASFELTSPDEPEMKRRMAALFEGGFPYLAAESGHELLGYAYVGHYRTRPAYRFSVEDSIYIAPHAQRRGIGRALLDRLIAESESRGFRQMLAVIGDSANAASIAVHRAAGFAPVGTIAAAGWKFDRWLDVVLMQRGLGAAAATAPG